MSYTIVTSFSSWFQPCNCWNDSKAKKRGQPVLEHTVKPFCKFRQLWRVRILFYNFLSRQEILAQVAHCWVYVMSIRQTQDMKSKCHISHIFWTNYIFGKIKTLCYINFKNWYNNCTIIFPKKSFVQEILEAWHFDFRLITWRMTLLSVRLTKT